MVNNNLIVLKAELRSKLLEVNTYKEFLKREAISDDVSIFKNKIVTLKKEIKTIQDKLRYSEIFI